MSRRIEAAMHGTLGERASGGAVLALALAAGVAWAADAPAAGAAGACTLHAVDRVRTTSSQCTACHPGSAPGHGHPVSVAYATSTHRNLAPQGELPPEVVLVDGRMECTTCHDGASQVRNHLARTGRALCLACHRM